MEDILEGWIKLHRSLLEWRYWGDHEALTLWIYLLQMANHKEGWSFRGIKLNPGQLLTGRDKIAEACCLHRSKVERILKKLEIEQQIEQQKTNKWRVITIVKWKEYQVEGQQVEHQIEQQMSNKRATDEHIQELKKDKNEKKVRSKKAQAIPTQLPKGLIYDFLPSSELEFYQFAFSTVTQKLQKDLLKRCGSESVLVKHLEKFRIAVENGRTVANYGLSISNWLKLGLEWDEEKIDPEEKRRQSDKYFLQDGQISEETRTIDFAEAIKLAEGLWTKD